MNRARIGLPEAAKVAVELGRQDLEEVQDERYLQIAELESDSSQALDAHPDGEFFRSCGSVTCAATLLSEIGDCRGRYPHRDAVAADGGQAPVAQQCGKRKHPKFRWACNKRLRKASQRWPGAHASGTAGTPTATPPPEPEATTTAERCAPSAAPGVASSGAAGPPTPPLTAPGIPACNSTCW